ncbi:2-acylglycerol O-acyltransferase 2-A-like isoform X2 [Photinus pyralis]|nr:2-acylglycerol O-acyltransferase 2-A-like isoform X2 [Photinus pyralis]XP_031338065.1 2-acylglycerol O-acyltransferase 2-A-like isoform X2 [Photinus pyralis]XP_031338066.1 2-acylglycerol O-acyltransferase 2-A-like isoform X2 [Photinus pyralis]
MEVLGVKFAPINIPFRRRIQTLSAAAWFITMAFGGFIGLFLAVYMILQTRLWLVTIAYLIWAWGMDRHTCKKGGRRVEWVRSWTWWKYLKEYFPLNLERVPWVELDPKRNYLFCCFPHGMLPTGAFSAFGTNVGGFHDLFPTHKPYVLTLSQHFYMPFFRELAYALGGCCSSADSINWILSQPDGGKAAILAVGGAAESYNCRPGQYRVVLKNRKGFVKLAIKNGAPLVPVISFGETDLFSQVPSPEGSVIRYIQEFIRKLIGIAPALPLGRGFFQYSFGLVPQRKPVTTVVGRPLNVEKIEKPTQDDIDEVHEKFIECLVEMFEEQKHHYIKDADSTVFEIE